MEPMGTGQANSRHCRSVRTFSGTIRARAFWCGYYSVPDGFSANLGRGFNRIY
jgi:hypothetical protein